MLAIESGRSAIRSEVGHQSEIVSLLDVVRGQVGETSETGGEDITVVAVQAGTALGDGTGGDVDDTGEEFTTNTVHVGDHQHETLGGGEGSGEDTTQESAVKSTSGTGFGLHLGDGHWLAEDVLLALHSPSIAQFTNG